MIRTRNLPAVFVGAIALMTFSSCGGQQQQQAGLETRPLEEAKAHEIIASVLAARNYVVTTEVGIKLANGGSFPCDFKAEKHGFAIEYVTRQDRTVMGEIPPAAQGSRLHVVPAKTVPSDPSVGGEAVYVFLIDENGYQYQHNPTSENRADVTFLEVESRLRRDLTDFLAWYESSTDVEQ